ncbi:MAG: YhbY family RNA-binding protein [Candidatus Methanoperedens sp.]|nr:YhbY family RNA-binding protein [Candidatus Methanoperedens sp.]
MNSKQQYKADTPGLEVSLHVGKSGIDKVVEELRMQLKNRRIVKVKFLKTAIIDGNKQELAEKLANLTDSEVIEVRGNTAVFCRKGLNTIR